MLAGLTAHRCRPLRDVCHCLSAPGPGSLAWVSELWEGPDVQAVEITLCRPDDPRAALGVSVMHANRPASIGH